MPLKTPGMVQSAPAHVEEVISTGRWLEHHLQVRSLAKAIAEAWPSACLCAYISAGACNFKLLTTMSEGAAEQFEIGTRSDYMLRCAASNRLPHVQVALSVAPSLPSKYKGKREGRGGRSTEAESGDGMVALSAYAFCCCQCFCPTTSNLTLLFLC